MKIKKITKVKYSGIVYNIGVEDNNNYFANDILVHNCYVSASYGGMNFPNICETWTKWMNTFPKDEVIEGTNIIKTKKPFQIAIGILI